MSKRKRDNRPPLKRQETEVKVERLLSKENLIAAKPLSSKSSVQATQILYLLGLTLPHRH
jgi:hypothetical protein